MRSYRNCDLLNWSGLPCQEEGYLESLMFLFVEGQQDTIYRPLYNEGTAQLSMPTLQGSILRVCNHETLLYLNSYYFRSFP